MQICYTWIWDDLLTKYVNAMVEHKTFAEMRVMREALEEATREIRAKDDQVRVKDDLVRAKAEQVLAKDQQIALILAEIALLKTKIEKSSSSLRTYKMLFWGLLLACFASSISNSL
jgi:predicted phage gp36 major capsid-like protein